MKKMNKSIKQTFETLLKSGNYVEKNEGGKKRVYE